MSSSQEEEYVAFSFRYLWSTRSLKLLTANHSQIVKWRSHNNNNQHTRGMIQIGSGALYGKVWIRGAACMISCW